MTCAFCQGSGLLDTMNSIGDHFREPCVCERGAIQRIRNNRKAIDRYRETMEPSDLADRIESIRGSRPAVATGRPAAPPGACHSPPYGGSCCRVGANDFLVQNLRVHPMRRIVIAHGHARRAGRTAEYRAWKNMRNRCKPGYFRHDAYHDRGISVCKRWGRFKAFLEDMGMRPDGMTLERVDNELGYSPSNCIWATMLTQSRNKRSNVLLSAFGERKAISEWAEDGRCKVSQQGLRARIYRGWEPQEALETPFVGITGKRKRRKIA